MAKYKQNAPVKKESTKSYPSQYGSHASMVNDEFIEFNSMGHLVVCTDGRGNYITEKKMLDNGFCDYNRSVNVDLREARFNELINGVNG